jgi:hypothetical protein
MPAESFPAPGLVPAAGPTAGRMLFILSPPRSYSTVITAMFGGHPDVYAFPEMLVFTAPTIGDLLREARTGPPRPDWLHESRLSGPRRAVADIHEGSQEPDALRRAARWLEGHAGWTAAQLLDYLRRRVPARLAVEKSPDTAGSDTALQRCLASYPDASYLHLVRHPADTQRSMQRHWRILLPDSERALVANAATSWYRTHRRVIRALDGLPAGQWLRVRAEDVLLEPRTWLPRLADWAGLSMSPDILTAMLATEKWRFAGGGPTGKLGGGDPVFMSGPALKAISPPGPLAFDPAWRLPPQMGELMIDLARFLGY